MKSSLIFTLLAMASLALVGCGPSDKKAGAGSAAAAAQPADGSRVVEITGNDAMKFSVTEITAKPGEKLTVVLKNVGRMPKQAMGHNWVLLKPMTDGEVNALGMAASSKAPEYLPDDRSAVLAHTKILGPNETDRITFAAPADAGEYPFLCTFPGHFAMMKGKLVVK